MGTLVYKYGLRRPTVNATLVDDQMRLAQRFYNRLVEIMREQRAKRRVIMQKRDEVLAPLRAASVAARAELDAAVGELKEVRKRERRRAETVAQRDQVARLRARYEEVYAAEKAAKSQLGIDDGMRIAFKAAQEEAAAAVRSAREVCGVYWGTYLQIEAAVEAADKAMPLWDDTGAENDPAFKRWRGEGAVAVQLQHGLAAERALGGSDTRLQIVMATQVGGHASKTAQKRRFGVVRLRVGSVGRDPVWAEWPILMHRPLPEGAVIKWAKVKRTMVADHDRWDLHLTLDVPEEVRREQCGPDGAVAVNFGWRELPEGGRRVAYWRDEDDNEGEIREDPGVLSGLRKVEDLQSIRSREMDELKAWIGSWLRGQDVPEALREEVAHVAQWKSPARFVALGHRWAETRWDGDEEGFQRLDAWAKHDRHLWQWQEHQRRKSLRRRQDQHRNEAARLARRYGVLIVEDFDMRKTQRHKTPEDEAEIPAQRLQQKEAAPSELRLALRQAFAGCGGKVVTVGARLNTQRCDRCGSEERWDAAPRVEHTCAACGAWWDQDANNTRNILRRFRERPDEVEVDVTKPLAKWAQRGRHGGAAREEGGNVAEVQ